MTKLISSLLAAPACAAMTAAIAGCVFPLAYTPPALAQAPLTKPVLSLSKGSGQQAFPTKPMCSHVPYCMNQVTKADTDRMSKVIKAAGIRAE